jgi:hypothetical protein
MPRPLSTPGKGPVSVVQEAGWAPGPVWTGAENLDPTRIRSPDRPVCSQSLYNVYLSVMDCFLCCVLCVLYCSVTAYYSMLLFSFCVFYWSFFLYCTVSACVIRAATLAEGFPCLFLSCKANARV